MNNSEKRLKTEYLINEDLRAIQNSTIYGNTFEKNLKNIEFFLDMKAPVILKNVSETGIPTMKNLSESFPKFARLALTADRNEQETANFKILILFSSLAKKLTPQAIAMTMIRNNDNLKSDINMCRFSYSSII